MVPPSLHLGGCATKVHGFTPVDLPKPESLDAPDMMPEHYHRLAVAYGLSFSHLDMGKIIAPSELEDIRADRRDTTTAFVSKEMV